MSVDLKKTQIVAMGSAIPKKLTSFIWMFLRRHPFSLAMFTFYVVFEGVITTISAYLLKVLIDGAISAGDQTQAIMAALLLPALLYAGLQLAMNITYTAYRIVHLQFYPKFKSDIASNHYY